MRLAFFSRCLALKGARSLYIERTTARSATAEAGAMAARAKAVERPEVTAGPFAGDSLGGITLISLAKFKAVARAGCHHPNLHPTHVFGRFSMHPQS